MIECHCSANRSTRDHQIILSRWELELEKSQRKRYGVGIVGWSRVYHNPKQLRTWRHRKSLLCQQEIEGICLWRLSLVPYLRSRPRPLSTPWSSRQSSPFFQGFLFFIFLFSSLSLSLLFIVLYWYEQSKRTKPMFDFFAFVSWIYVELGLLL